ncbi:hypothetical protein KIPB_016245, partial [Kipferlia bialata]
RERLAFESVYSKSNHAVGSNQAEIQELISQSITAHREREEALRKLAQLQREGAREAKAYDEEWRDMG